MANFITNNNYCWMRVYGVDDNHESATCYHPERGKAIMPHVPTQWESQTRTKPHLDGSNIEAKQQDLSQLTDMGN